MTKPRFTLVTFFLLFVIVGLTTALYVNSRNAAEKLRQEQEKYLLLLEREHYDNNLTRLMTGMPARTNRCIFVTSGMPYHKSNPYRVFAYVDPSKTMLLKVAYQELPKSGYPPAAEVYVLPKIGQEETARNLLRLDIFFEGKNISFENREPFQGKILVMPYYANYFLEGEHYQRNDPLLISSRRFLSTELSFEKPESLNSWADLLSNGHEFDNIRAGQPAPLLRFREKPENEDLSNGLMLWLEEVPEDNIPLGTKQLDQ